jgi:hypothetical protein
MPDQEKCQMCGAEFPSKEALQQHNQQQHPRQQQEQQR